MRELSNWFYIEKDGDENPVIKGPVVLESLIKLYNSKVINSQTIFWNEVDQLWVELHCLPIFYEIDPGDITRKRQNPGGCKFPARQKREFRIRRVTTKRGIQYHVAKRCKKHP